MPHEKSGTLWCEDRVGKTLGKNLKLTARINKNYTNSSKSSSMSPNHKTIQNNREKTDRRPGDQPGHVHHVRKRREPDPTIQIQALKEYAGREFTEGVKDDVNYDGSVKTAAYLFNNEYYVSINKIRTFLHEISDDRINLSNGMICNLSRQFSEKTKDERNQIFLKLLESPTLHADFTFGRMEGKQGIVMISTTPCLFLYQAREQKGHKMYINQNVFGICKDTPINRIYLHILPPILYLPIPYL